MRGPRRGPADQPSPGDRSGVLFADPQARIGLVHRDGRDLRRGRHFLGRVQRAAGVDDPVDIIDYELVYPGSQVRLRADQEDVALHERPHDPQDLGDVSGGHPADILVLVGVDHHPAAAAGEDLFQHHTLDLRVEDVDPVHALGARPGRPGRSHPSSLPWPCPGSGSAAPELRGR